MNEEYAKKFEDLMLTVLAWTDMLKEEHGLSTDEALKTIMIVATIDNGDQSMRIWSALDDVKNELSGIWSAIDALPL